MKNHRRKAIGTAVAGLLLGAIVGSSSALANVPDAQCVGSCRQARRAGELTCMKDNNCRMEYRVCRQDCVAALIPGPDRQECFIGFCKKGLGNCRTELASCKKERGTDFLSCKDNCGTAQ